MLYDIHSSPFSAVDGPNIIFMTNEILADVRPFWVVSSVQNIFWVRSMATINNENVNFNWNRFSFGLNEWKIVTEIIAIYIK